MRSVVSTAMISALLLCQLVGFLAHRHSPLSHHGNSSSTSTDESPFFPSDSSRGFHVHLNFSHLNFGGQKEKSASSDHPTEHHHHPHGPAHHQDDADLADNPSEPKPEDHDNDAIYLNFDQVVASGTQNFQFQVSVGLVSFINPVHSVIQQPNASFEKPNNLCGLISGRDILRHHCALLL